MSQTTKIVNAYAKAFYQNLLYTGHSNVSFPGMLMKSQSGTSFSSNLDTIGQELEILRACFLYSKELEKVFQNPTIPDKEKMRAIISVIPGLSPRVNAFLKILADRNHLFLLPAISKKFHFFLEKSKKIIHVRFQIAGAFPKHFGFELFALLQKITKTDQIILKASYEPKLLGGSIFEYNSLALDKSILKEFGDFFKEN